MGYWDEIRGRDRPKTVLVSINGREEERGTITNDDDPNGTYIQRESGVVTPYVSDLESERELIYPEEERQRTLVIRRSLHTTPKGGKSDQRENIFQTKCRVGDKLCDLIIDGGSETNCVSLDLVQKLKLKTQAHPHPYKLRWLDDKSFGSVGKQCLITLTIGSYQDQVLCDVINLSACHILLGRPWQYDKRANHDGYTNIYTFRHEGKLKDLIPLPPPKAIPPPKTKQPVHLTSRKGCVRKKKPAGHFWSELSKEAEPVIKRFSVAAPEFSLIDLPVLYRYSINSHKQAEYLRKTHKQVHEKMMKTKARYQHRANRGLC